MLLKEFFNTTGLKFQTTNQERKIVAHAGTLSEVVGVSKILDYLKNSKSIDELWLMGNGDLSERIIEQANKDERLVYFGFINKEEVFLKLQQARLLLILRDPNEDYTKYSFPSKLFEYMASGTPVAISHLPGIPKEYHRYLYILKK